MNLEKEFPILRDQIFFNHSAVAPLPARAAEALRRWSEEAQTQVGAVWREWAAALARARANAARLVGAGLDEIAFAHNTTHALLIVAGSLPWRPGDNVIVAEREFPANVHPWRTLRARGVAVRTAPERPDCRFAVEDFDRLIDERTRLVAISLVQYSTGYRMPAEAIARICRERGALLCLDAIQAVGAMPVDVKKLDCDFLAADGHKWLLAPEGLALFYVRKAALAQMNDAMTGWVGRVRPADYDDIEQPLQNAARRFEEGSHAMSLAVAFEKSSELLLEVGVDEAWRRIEALTDRLVERLTDAGFEVASPRGAGEKSGIVAFGREGLDVAAAARALAERGVHVAARRGFLRASPHFYNNERQIDRFVELLKDMP